MTIYTAELDSSNFSFRATDLSARGAKNALVIGLTKHGKKHNLAAKWWKDIACDIVIVETTVGGCLCDRETV
jgi:hypothetical protein